MSAGRYSNETTDSLTAPLGSSNEASQSQTTPSHTTTTSVQPSSIPNDGENYPPSQSHGIQNTSQATILIAAGRTPHASDLRTSDPMPAVPPPSDRVSPPDYSTSPTTIFPVSNSHQPGLNTLNHRHHPQAPPINTSIVDAPTAADESSWNSNQFQESINSQNTPPSHVPPRRNRKNSLRSKIFAKNVLPPSSGDAPIELQSQANQASHSSTSSNFGPHHLGKNFLVIYISYFSVYIFLVAQY